MSSPGFPAPVSIYINWAAYDLLSDNVPLTEQLALSQLDHLLRLRREGVRFDYYLMDAFWFAPAGGYRRWDERYWSQSGPERWISRCHENGVLPGLWVACNALQTPIFRHLEAPAAWRESLAPDGGSACFFHGGFLTDFIAALQHWVDRGIRLFKFDFADFEAAPEGVQRSCLPSEIRRRNAEAFELALRGFRDRNPEVRLIAYNGFMESRDVAAMSGTGLPVRRVIDTRWLDVFDAVYCGDPRPADVPCANFWRSKDIYSDHMVRYFEVNGFPLSRIDNAGFMIGTTGTCYGRRKQAWRGMLILSLARGGWANTYYGNLDLLTTDDARWFARAQGLFFRLQREAAWQTFGAMPGSGEPYGFRAAHPDGEVVAVVNPGQLARKVTLPASESRVIFRDRGFVAQVQGAELTLGPEQLVVVASGRFAEVEGDLGEEPEVWSAPLASVHPARFSADSSQGLRARIDSPPTLGQLRVVLRQTRHGRPLRSSGGPPPDGMTLGRILVIEAEQGGRRVSVRTNYDLAIWSGLSWAVGEIAAAELAAEVPLDIVCRSMETGPVELHGEILVVNES